MLRITNGMMANTLMRNMNNSMLRMDELERQMSSNKKINKPSDDPGGLVKALRLRTNLTESEQYRRNIAEATSLMQTTDDALGSVDDIMVKIKELTVKAATGTNSPDSRNAIALEIQELNDQLKLISKSTYGTKYIFSGTNVTESPMQNGEWVGNDKIMEYEIGVGVTVPVNLNMKGYFTGQFDDLHLASSSGIQSLEAKNLQEGSYTVNTFIGPAAGSTAAETQSYMSSVSKNGTFFYQDATHSAQLGAGTTAGGSDSQYNTSLMLEVKYVKNGVPVGTPRATMAGSSLTFTKDLYQNDANGHLTAIADASNMTSNFTYTGAGHLDSATYVAATKTINFSTTGAVAGDTIILNNDVGGTGKSRVFDVNSNEYTPVKAVFDGTNWVYDDKAKVTVDIKGHVYNSSGEYKYVEMQSVEIDMETGTGGALFTIPASKFNDATNFPDNLVIYNSSAAALGSIDPKNPQIAVGDKTIISTTAQATANSEKIKLGATFKDKNGTKLGEKTQSFNFNDGYFDNHARDLKFFTLSQETGLSYDGRLTVTAADFAATNVAERTTSFDYKQGLFSYVDDLARKVVVGKLPQVGNELQGHSERLEELLLFRSTLGARINRLELQTSRLTSTEENMTALLASTEDADLAQVIMNLKMQENSYQSSLAAGARIIQPTLTDFLR